jgi:hypothetical protein
LYLLKKSLCKSTIYKGILKALNGYGVIGKRIADAVNLQDDMELIGVNDVAICRFGPANAVDLGCRYNLPKTKVRHLWGRIEAKISGAFVSIAL